jgi:hypothetical protein
LCRSGGRWISGSWKNDVSSIRETLAQLDDRLEDLRQQVARLTDEPAAVPAEPTPGTPSRFSVTRLSGGSEDPHQARASEAPAFDATHSAVHPETAVEIKELLAACDRLLRETRELMGARNADQARPAFFEGTVTLVALGANLLQTVEVLEDSLVRARQVTRAYIRRVHAGEARVELSLTGGVDLVGELNRVMPFPFAVRSATREEIVITLEGGGVEL